MKLLQRLTIAATFALASTAGAQVTVTPTSNGGPFCLSGSFSTASCSIGDQHLGSHLRFQNTATFNDPPVAWGGINGSNVVDLYAPVTASLWSTDGLAKMQTSYLTVLAGNSEPNTLTLKVFDVLGNLLGTAMNPSSNASYFTVTAAGIHSFEVSGSDTFGVREVSFADPTLVGVSTVPEPGSFVLVAAGLAGLVVAGRNRKRIAK